MLKDQDGNVGNDSESSTGQHDVPSDLEKY